MSRQQLIDQTVEVLQRLPETEVNEAAQFIGSLLKRHEEEFLWRGIQHLADDSNAFAFLKEEEDLYTTADLKVRYR